MILATTSTAVLLLLILAAFLLGSWANTFKAGRPWRFELYYFDFTVGLLIASLLAAFTLGSLGDDLTFEDNLLIAGKRNMAWAVGGGAVLNLGNLMLMASVSLAGMAAAFPLALGMGLITGAVWTFFLADATKPLLLFGGAAVLAGALLVAVLAHHASADRNRAKFSLKAIIIALVGGLFLGSSTPFFDIAKATDIGLGPYATVVFAAIGVFFSTLIYNLYFMNLPVEGQPVGFVDYFRGSMRNHFLGILGGFLWCAGALAYFAAAAAPREAHAGEALTFALGNGAALFAALWGIAVWKELSGTEGRVKALVVLMLALYAGGLALIAFSLRP